MKLISTIAVTLGLISLCFSAKAQIVNLNVNVNIVDNSGIEVIFDNNGNEDLDIKYSIIIQDDAMLTDGQITIDIGNNITIYVPVDSAKYKSYEVIISDNSGNRTAMTYMFPGAHSGHYNNLTFYPNPCIDEFVISSDFDEKVIRHITVFDIFGIARLSIEWKNSSSCTVDIAELPKGIYFARVTDNRSSKVQKLVKL